jgi:hypothetical protein
MTRNCRKQPAAARKLAAGCGAHARCGAAAPELRSAAEAGGHAARHRLQVWGMCIGAIQTIPPATEQFTQALDIWLVGPATAARHAAAGSLQQLPAPTPACTKACLPCQTVPAPLPPV